MFIVVKKSNNKFLTKAFEWSNDPTEMNKQLTDNLHTQLGVL